jgi:hypothetical protein
MLVGPRAKECVKHLSDLLRPNGLYCNLIDQSSGRTGG